MVREAVAGHLQNRITGSRIADICSGSGAFGFEMLSRGARSVDFIDNNHQRCALTKKNAGHFNVEDTCRVIKRDVRDFLKTCNNTYDIIYYDPPYSEAPLAEIIPNILSFLAPKGILVYERRRGDGTEFATSDKFNIKTRTYGDTQLVFFTHLQE